MPELSIRYDCSHCGESQTYRLAADVASDPAVELPPAEIPSISFRCMHCGASATYNLAPEGAPADA